MATNLRLWDCSWPNWSMSGWIYAMLSYLLGTEKGIMRIQSSDWSKLQ